MSDKVDLRDEEAALNMHQIDTIILTFNTDESLLSSCIESVQVSYASLGIEGAIQIFDNGSSTPSKVAVRDDIPTVMHLNGENLGFGRAMNRAIGMSSADFVFLLNPDAALEKGALKELLLVAEADRGILAVGLLELYGGVQVDSVIDWTFSIERLLKRRNFKRRYMQGTSSVSAFSERVLSIEKACGGALLARRDDLLEMGPFDESFFLYGEDADLSRRWLKSGRRIALATRAMIRHTASSSQEHHGILVEKSRTDAALRLAAVHKPYFVSLLCRLELLLVTAVGLLLRTTSSGSRLTRLARFDELRRWGLHGSVNRLDPHA